MSELLEIIEGAIPTQMQWEWGGIVATIGTTFSYICGWDKATEVLLWLMVLDYISGIMAAYINSNMTLDSRKGYKGIVKKVMILVLVSLAHFMDSATGQLIAQTVVVWFFIGNEGLSIIENASKAGLPVPEKLKETLEQLKEQKGTKKP